VNIAKNKVMRVTRNENVDDLDIIFSLIKTEDVDCIRYLGVDIDRDGGMKSEMKLKVSEALKVYGF
jgi:hypothetical protein